MSGSVAGQHRSRPCWGLVKVDLTGHHSNTSRPVSALLASTIEARVAARSGRTRFPRRDIKRRETSTGGIHRRHDWVQAADIRVLEKREAPMQPREVHGGVESARFSSGAQASGCVTCSPVICARLTMTT